MSKGNHTIKSGGEIAGRRYNQAGNQFPRGFFQGPSQYTANPSQLSMKGSVFATALLGWTSESTRAHGIANVQFRHWAYSTYVEDSWKIKPNLALNVGMRYEFTPPWKDRYRGIINVKLFCTGTDGNGIDPTCPVPVLVRSGEGDLHDGLSRTSFRRRPGTTRFAAVPPSARTRTTSGRASVSPGSPCRR